MTRMDPKPHDPGRYRPHGHDPNQRNTEALRPKEHRETQSTTTRATRNGTARRPPTRPSAPRGERVPEAGPWSRATVSPVGATLPEAGRHPQAKIHDPGCGRIL